MSILRVSRIGPPESPLVPLSGRVLVSRNLGDVIQASAFPTLRLTDVFRVFGSINYYRKASDTYEIAAVGSGGLAVNAPSSAEPLERESAMQAWSFGGGIAYRSDRSTTGRVLPIEAGLNYRSAFSGAGGLTPKTNSVQIVFLSR